MKKNKAFTIAELALVLVFIGFISIIALYTVNNRFTDFYSRYTTAYDALSKAIYHIHTDTYFVRDKECVMDENKLTDMEDLMLDYGEMTSFDFNSLDYRQVRDLQKITEYDNKPYAFKYGNFDLVDMIHAFITQNQRENA